MHAARTEKGRASVPQIKAQWAGMQTFFFPGPKAESQGAEQRGSWAKDMWQGWGYMVARLGLMGLALLFSLVDFFQGTAEAVLTPMILSFINFGVAYLIGGPLAGRVFEPLMADGGTLAGSLGQLIGAGPGRGMGLMFVVMGLLAIATAVSAFAYPRIRNVEVELPDAVQ